MHTVYNNESGTNDLKVIIFLLNFEEVLYLYSMFFFSFFFVTEF